MDCALELPSNWMAVLAELTQKSLHPPSQPAKIQDHSMPERSLIEALIRASQGRSSSLRPPGDFASILRPT